MNLFDYHHWERTKMWLIVIVPLIVIFLFIQPFISLFLLFVIFGRLLYVKLLQSSFDKLVRESENEFHKKLDGVVKLVSDTKAEIEIAEADEILALTDDFPNVRINFIETTGEYMVIYEKNIGHFSDFRKIREWLNSVVR